MLDPSAKKDSAFAASLRALFYEKPGNCSLADTGKNKTRIDEAIVEYERAVEIWKTSEVLNIYGIRQDDKLPALERKINRLKNL